MSSMPACLAAVESEAAAAWLPGSLPASPSLGGCNTCKGLDALLMVGLLATAEAADALAFLYKSSRFVEAPSLQTEVLYD